jgi:hypothetical protein
VEDAVAVAVEPFDQRCGLGGFIFLSEVGGGWAASPCSMWPLWRTRIAACIGAPPCCDATRRLNLGAKHAAALYLFVGLP